MPPKKPRRGRPPKPAADRRRHILSVRVRDETRQQLEAAAAAAGRSVSEEVESRVERSFVDRDYLTRLENLLGGKATVGLAMILARVMHQVGMNAAGIANLSAGKMEGGKPANPDDFSNWPTIPYAFDQAVKAIATVLESLRPPGDATVPKLEGIKWSAGLDDAKASEIARASLVTEALQSVADPASAPNEEQRRWGLEVASRLVPPAKGTKP